jgi:hypothetical protein
LKILTAIDRLMRRQRLSISFNRLFRDVRKDSLITGVTVLLDSFTNEEPTLVPLYSVFKEPDSSLRTISKSTAAEIDCQSLNR